MACRMPQHLFQTCDSKDSYARSEQAFLKNLIKCGLTPTNVMLAQVRMIIEIDAKCYLEGKLAQLKAY